VGQLGLHLPGAFSAWKKWRGPKKLVIGPGVYLDRPVYQYQDESLRWSIYWLKGIDTGSMNEPPIPASSRTGEWENLSIGHRPGALDDVFLHKDGILSEHELWPQKRGFFDESNFEHGALTLRNAVLVEIRVLGPRC